MNSSARRVLFSSFIFWLLVGGACLYFVMPLNKKLKFGIDLIGGSYMTLEVQTEKAVESELMSFMQRIPEKLETKNIALPSSKNVKQEKITLTFEDINAATAAAVELKGTKDMNVSVSGNQVLIKFTESKAEKIKSNAVATNIEVFRTRLSRLMSVAEITIATQGDRNIIIELPGVTDPMQARSMIGRRAVLEFKLVERTGRSEDDLLYEYDGELPDDMEILPGKLDKDGTRNYYMVPKFAEITGKMLEDARSKIGGSMGMQPVIEFRFSSEGGEKFYDLTSRNYGRQLAVVLDDEIIMAAKINAAIRRDGIIEGGFTSEEAKDRAMLLRSGALVAPITIDGEQQIGPTLGAESIKQGLVSCLVGLGLLLLFSLFYYSLAGLFAFIALMFNLCLVLFGLYAVGAVLTLPGIAGMVLTIGMAIDASILIYERIKDGLAEGISIKKAVNEGFSTAMVVILDANITTFIVGVVLYKFGTGPLQGFAVTMMLGIISTLITGLFFLRSLFNFVLDNFKVQKLRI
ncbi:protein translocase subunit SecD [bacterium]|nr:protein translocase subunit SecD [bacterium]